MEALKQQSAQPHYTYKDYASWELKEGERFELLDGVPYAISAPSPVHQGISGELHRQFANFLHGKPCKVFHAPFDVRLNAKGDKDDNVVQPDLLVICDKTKIDDKGCNGAPDLVVEIVSPSSSKHDRFIKFQKYQNAGVREYWIVDIEANGIEVALLKDEKYTVLKYLEEDVIFSSVLEGFQINVKEIFAE
ncbi:MAG: Uma2 family endonuclease [Oscillospiraceae bacterium]|nr:Uma2 family endonuclease [Oscillospiraceae bacterium]